MNMSQLMHIKHSCRNDRKYFTEKQTKQHSFNNLERKKDKGMAGGLDGGRDKMTKSMTKWQNSKEQIVFGHIKMHGYQVIWFRYITAGW